MDVDEHVCVEGDVGLDLADSGVAGRDGVKEGGGGRQAVDAVDFPGSGDGGDAVVV